jgi:hypothetical protein
VSGIFYVVTHLHSGNRHPASGIGRPISGLRADVQALFSQQPIAAEFTVYNVMQGDYPSDDLTFDAYLVTGSKADSFGTDPWIQTLKPTC